MPEPVSVTDSVTAETGSSTPAFTGANTLSVANVGHRVSRVSILNDSSTFRAENAARADLTEKR